MSGEVSRIFSIEEVALAEKVITEFPNLFRGMSLTRAVDLACKLRRIDVDPEHCAENDPPLYLGHELTAHERERALFGRYDACVEREDAIKQALANGPW